MDNLTNVYELRTTNQNKFAIYEKTSEIMFGNFPTYSAANKVLSNLKDGKAFEGWIPKFFTVEGLPSTEN